VRWLSCLLVGGLLVNCFPELDDAVITRGRYVNVYADPSIPVCAGAIAIADRFVEDTAAMLGVSPRPIDYYLFDGPTGCGLGQDAWASCAVNGTVYANVWIHFHELVHAVDDSHPPALFVEGLAEALSRPSDDARDDVNPRATAQINLESSAFRAGDPWENYRVAGDFVRYLVERFGALRYRSFARSLVSLSDSITTRRAFESVYGVSIDDVIAHWRVTDPAASTMTVPVDLVTCDAPIAPIAEDTWAIDDVAPNGCSSGTTTGGTSYFQPARRYGFEVSEPGMFVVNVRANGGQRVLVRSCAPTAAHEYVTPADSTRFMTLALRAGRHAIELPDGARGWSIARLGTGGATCEAAATFSAPADEAWQLELRARPRTWIRIAYPGTRSLVGLARMSPPARACTGSCSALRCRPIIHNAPLDHHPGEPLYIEVGAADEALQSVTIRTAGDD
jgi:hypothetical protein